MANDDPYSSEEFCSSFQFQFKELLQLTLDQQGETKISLNNVTRIYSTRKDILGEMTDTVFARQLITDTVFARHLVTDTVPYMSGIFLVISTFI